MLATHIISKTLILIKHVLTIEISFTENSYVETSK